jgi:hypothetical protein
MALAQERLNTDMLEGFYVIESWRTESRNLSVRLVPDHFEEGLSDPVVTIAVAELQDPVGCDVALVRRKGELIVDLEVSEGRAAILAEHDDEPASLRGSAVTMTRGPYSSEDLRRIVQQKDEELSRCCEQIQIYRSTIDGTEKFVSELIRRAEVKRELTSRDSASLDLEMDVLRRVLQRILSGRGHR